MEPNNPVVEGQIMPELTQAASLTPSPVKKIEPKMLTFLEAMQEVINHKKITKASWGDRNEYALLQDDWLVIHTKGEDHKWTITYGDMEGNDWLVIE